MKTQNSSLLSYNNNDLGLCTLGVSVLFEEISLTGTESSNQSTMLCVQHSAVLERQFSVNISFEDINTTIEDFNHEVSVIEFNSNSENTQCILLTINTDDVLERDEEFLALLTTTDEDIDIVNGTVHVIILDTSILEVGFTNVAHNVNEGENLLVCVVIFSGSLTPEVVVSLLVVPQDGQGNGYTPSDYGEC